MGANWHIGSPSASPTSMGVHPSPPVGDGMALDPLTALLDVGGKLIDKLFPDPGQKAAALLKLRELEQSGDLAIIAAQSDINRVEAASPRLFVSGWRPMVGWTCCAGFAMQFVVAPLL